MHPARLLAPCLALCLSSFPLLADDLPGTDFASGNWSGRAWADNGAFVDCYFGVTYSGNEILSVSLKPDDTLTVYLSAPGMTFNPNQTYQASLMTEVGYPVTGTAFAPNQEYIGFGLAGIDDSINFLTQGSYLRLSGVGIEQSFDVRGMGGALVHAKACLNNQMGGAATAAAEPAAPAAPAKPVLGIKGKAAAPAQLSGDIAVFKRLHLP